MLHYCDKYVRAKLTKTIIGALCGSGVLLLAAAVARAEPSTCAASLPTRAAGLIDQSASDLAPPDAVRTIPTVLAGVPALIRIPPTVKKAPIVLWHGLGPPSSEAELMKDLPLDDVPAVKIYLGLPLFGARAPAAGTDSLAQRQAQDYATRIFEPIVFGAARELPAVLGELSKLGCLRPGEKVGLFGFSAGGTAALIALMNDKAPIAVAVTVNAPSGLRSAVGALERATKQPYVWSDASLRLAERSDATLHATQIAATTAGQPRALLLFQGADDSMIAPADTVSLDRSLRPVYEQSRDPHRLQLTVASGVSHDWADPKTVGQVRTAVADWFNRYL
jgi:dienelactone hydrolase